VCLAAALLLAADDANTKLEDFAPKGGRFAVQMPGPPKEQTNKVNTAVGPIDVHMFVLSPDPNTAYIVGYSDYPEEMIKKSDIQKVLDGARDGAVKNVNGKLDWEKKITIDKHPGRDFAISTEHFEGRDRIYLVNARLYQVMVVGSKDFITDKVAQKFLDSFKLTEKE
jgi:hypothetical protein